MGAERWLSGRKRRSRKPVYLMGIVGSNPTLSARLERILRLFAQPDLLVAYNKSGRAEQFHIIRLPIVYRLSPVEYYLCL